MTKREAAIVSAYTGFLVGDFDDIHEYVEKLMDRPVFTHEFASRTFVKELKKRAKNDFISIEVK